MAFIIGHLKRHRQLSAHGHGQKVLYETLRASGTGLLHHRSGTSLGRVAESSGRASSDTNA